MGVQHLKTLSHTLRHNGTTQRRHQHIVYTGLILLQQAKLPHKYCSHAFQTVIYLINRFPTPLLNFSSPYEKLFSKKPNCNKLKVFGCLYFPWLNHTILINFNPNLLLGFFLVTLLIKVRIFVWILQHKLFTTRHVWFLETEFLFSTSFSPNFSNSFNSIRA